MPDASSTSKPVEPILKDDLVRLAASPRPAPCVSVYLATARGGPETRESPYRLRLLLSEAEEKLRTAGFDPRVTNPLLHPMESLVDDYPFWQHPYGGVAFFSAKDLFRTHRTTYSVHDESFVGPRFHLKPLLPMWTEEAEFLVLALSRNSVRLYRARRHQLEPVALPDVPQSQDAALQFDNPEESLQVHAGQPGSRGGQTVVTHGQGASREEAKERTLRFFLRVDRALKPHLNRERVPLLLACVEYYLPLYRQANSYPHLVDAVIAGNPDGLQPGQLLEAAWAVMEPRFATTRHRALSAVEQELARGGATNDIEPAVAAACQGRAGRCVVALDEHRWGTYEADTANVMFLDRVDPRAVDLLDLAAAETLRTGGEVFPVPTRQDVPGQGPIAVLTRF